MHGEALKANKFLAGELKKRGTEKSSRVEVRMHGTAAKECEIASDGWSQALNGRLRHRGNGSAPRQTLEGLRELQRIAGAAIMRPLGARRMDKTWIDGRDTRKVVGEFIKPNDRLTSYERIEIYNRQYWFRLIDCLYDDYPGLLAILGQKKFSKLVETYLQHYPSRCFTLRNLGRSIEKYIGERPEFTAPRTELAMEMAQFESGSRWKRLTVKPGRPCQPTICSAGPGQAQAGAPAVHTALELNYPLDDYSIAVKQSQRAPRSEASNAMDDESAIREVTSASRCRRREKSSSPCIGSTIRFITSTSTRLPMRFWWHFAMAQASRGQLEKGVATSATPEQVQEWFKTWMELGWLCSDQHARDAMKNKTQPRSAKVAKNRREEVFTAIFPSRISFAALCASRLSFQPDALPITPRPSRSRHRRQRHHPAAGSSGKYSDDVFARAKKQNKFVLLDLEAVWCHWCHVMDETTYKDPKVIQLMHDRYIAVRVDQDARPDISSRYEDYGWPATVVFNGEGGEIVKRRGYLPPEEMSSMLQAIILDPTPGPSIQAAVAVKPSENSSLTDEVRKELQSRITSAYDKKYRAGADRRSSCIGTMSSGAL